MRKIRKFRRQNWSWQRIKRLMDSLGLNSQGTTQCGRCAMGWEFTGRARKQSFHTQESQSRGGRQLSKPEILQ